MAARSASDRPSRRSIPRWAFVAWLWAGVAYELLDEFHLVCRNWSPRCDVWSALGWGLGLFPGELAGFGAIFTSQKALYLAPVVFVAAVMTWAAQRYLPVRLSLRAAAILIVTWFALSYFTAALWVLTLSWPDLRH